MNLFILSRRTQVFFEGREIRISYWHMIIKGTGWGRKGPRHRSFGTRHIGTLFLLCKFLCMVVAPSLPLKCVF